MKKKPKRIMLGYRIERHSPGGIDHWGGRAWTKHHRNAMVFAKKKPAERRANKIRFGCGFLIKVIRVYRGDA